MVHSLPLYKSSNFSNRFLHVTLAKAPLQNTCTQLQITKSTKTSTVFLLGALTNYTSFSECGVWRPTWHV